MLEGSRQQKAEKTSALLHIKNKTHRRLLLAQGKKTNFRKKRVKVRDGVISSGRGTQRRVSDAHGGKGSKR